jgi:hypothetical protein
MNQKQLEALKKEAKDLRNQQSELFRRLTVLDLAIKQLEDSVAAKRGGDNGDDDEDDEEAPEEGGDN